MPQWPFCISNKSMKVMILNIAVLKYKLFFGEGKKKHDRGRGLPRGGCRINNHVSCMFIHVHMISPHMSAVTWILFIVHSEQSCSLLWVVGFFLQNNNACLTAMSPHQFKEIMLDILFPEMPTIISVGLSVTSAWWWSHTLEQHIFPSLTKP